MTHNTAAAEINNSPLPASTRANAFALLELAHPDNGFVCLGWAQVAALFRVKTIGGAREHLTRMQHGGLIRYSSDPEEDTVDIRFKAFSPRGGSESPRARGDSLPPRVDFARSDSKVSGANGTENGDLTRARVDLPAASHTREDLTTTTIQAGRQEGLPACLPSAGACETPETAPDETPDAQTDPAPAGDIARSVALLTDPEVGCDAAFAQALAVEFSFEEIRRQVCRWRRDFAAGSVTTAGALRKRLRGRWAATITDADRDTALWRRHETEDERYAETKRRYVPDEYADIILH